MSLSKDIIYWSPIDQFILKVIEKYGSLAMVGPRIQTPLDLKRWDEISSDTYKKYTLASQVREFYFNFMISESIMDPYKANTDNNTIIKSNNITNTSLMSHPPILGHWLNKSGFITEQDMKNDHEFSYLEYMKLFDMSDNPKRRKHMFPSFLGLEYSEIIGTKDPKSKTIKTKLLNEYVITPIFENKYDPETKSYSVGKVLGLKKYKVLDIDLKYEKTEIMGGIKFEYEDEPVLGIFNDNSNDNSEKGFLNTDIKYAYHMNFNINSQFSVTYNEIQKDESINTAVNQINKNAIFGRNYSDLFTVGYIDLKREQVDLDEIKRVQISTDDEIMKTINESDFQNLFQKYFNSNVPMVKNNIYGREESVYGSFEDYKRVNTKIEELMTKEYPNYFWFMYGALPTNNILFEDLYKSLSANYSVISKIENTSNWSRNQLEEVFSPRIKYFINESNKCDVYRQQCSGIKFLGLVYNLKNSDVKDILDDIVLYYSSPYSSNVIIENMNVQVLDNIYPKITSSKYTPKEFKKINISTDATSLPTQSDKTQAITIKFILSMDDITSDLLIRPYLDFLKNKNLMTEEGKSKLKIYDLYPNDPLPFQDLVKELKANTLPQLEEFILKPTGSPGSFIIPEDISRISGNLRFPDNDGRYMTSKDIENAKEIARIIVSPNTTIVSKNMLKFLAAWGIVNEEDTKIREYVMNNGKLFLTGLNNTDRIPEKYKKIKGELINLGFEDDNKYSNLKSKTIVDKDNWQTSTESCRNDSKKSDGKSVSFKLSDNIKDVPMFINPDKYKALDDNKKKSLRKKLEEAKDDEARRKIGKDFKEDNLPL